LPAITLQAGYRATLVTDEEEVAHLPESSSFAEPILLQYSAPKKCASELTRTRVYDVLQTALENWSLKNRPEFLWIHAAAMQAAWDAPHDVAIQFAAEDDPDPPEIFLPPSLSLPAQADPDFLLGYVQNYAAQVVATDAALGMFLDQLHMRGILQESWLIVTSPRGYPVGEHGNIGDCGDGLFGEVLQVPALIRAPDGAQALTRWPGVWQGSDWFATLASLMQQPVSHGFAITECLAGKCPLPQIAIASDTNQFAVRTGAWFYRESSEAEEKNASLYMKPDDRWEVNEIARRAARVTSEFQDWISHCRTSLDANTRQQVSLPMVLQQPLA
jgi:arylsulfatase A-like enzyme